MTDLGSFGLEEVAVSSETVFQGNFLRLNRDVVSMPNGALATREYVKHPGAVVILAILPDGNLVFERQYRYPLQRVFLELPAGKIDQGESPLNAAKRELREETGYEAGTWERLGIIHPCIGYSDEFIEVFRATDLVSQGGQNLDPNEFIELCDLSPSTVKTMIAAGEITDGKTIAAIFWLGN